MNYIYISPHFPNNFAQFIVALKKQGIKVLGIAGEPYGNLSHELRQALTEYYQVQSMDDYNQVLKACGYFTHKYGKIDRIESHNEHWLSLDACLRTDFNVFGFKSKDLLNIQSKWKMKEVFKKQDIPVAQGILVSDLKSAQSFTRKTGYPVVAKPDIGVGASHTYKINNNEELNQFFETKPKVDMIMEAYIQGEIHTFDGLTDTLGHVVYSNSFVFPVGVMETVNDDLDMIYYTQTEIPPDLDTYGRKIVKAFHLKERFFHIEFFRCKDGRLIVLEINVRPPGGYSMDIFNFANDMNFYEEYAKVVAGKEVETRHGNKHHCIYIGQKAKHANGYQLSREQVLSTYHSSLVFNGPIASIFSAAIGNYAYILKGTNLSQLLNDAHQILLKKEG